MADRSVTITIADTESVMRLDQLLNKCNVLLLKVEDAMAGLQDIRDAVARNNSVEASAAEMLRNISQQLKDLQGKAQDGQIAQADVDAIVNDIDSNARSLSSAVAENTGSQGQSGGETSGDGAQQQPNT